MSKAIYDEAVVTERSAEIVLKIYNENAICPPRALCSMLYELALVGKGCLQVTEWKDLKQSHFPKLRTIRINPHASDRYKIFAKSVSITDAKLGLHDKEIIFKFRLLALQAIWLMRVYFGIRYHRRSRWL